MSLYIGSIVIAAILFFLELLYFRLADRYNIIDRPNERSSHTRITLRGGGVLFFFGAWLYSAFYGFDYPLFLLGLTAICAVSFLDDVHSIPNRVRILVHFAAMLLLFAQWGILTAEQGWYVLPALILCTGIINAYNFMDGINGITGGYSLAVLIPLTVTNANAEFISPEFLSVTMLSVLVFCFFNFRKRAKCFAGDVGAVGIAFIIIFMLGLLIINTHHLWYLVFLAVYGVDTILTICHRLLLHENIFVAHRKHAYQLLANELHLPHTIVSTFYALLQLAISLGAIYLPLNPWLYFLLTVVGLSALYICFMIKYYPLHVAYLAEQQNKIPIC
ncbi:MAG: glycosyltransferase family 4 protein [Acinetobacter sp.]